LGALAREHVVVADVAESLSSLGDQVTVFEHVLGAAQILNVLDLGVHRVVVELGVAVESDCVLTSDDEVDLSYIALLIVQVALILVRFELAGHEAESHLVQEIGAQVAAGTEEALESAHRKNVLEEELAHNVVLNTRGDRIEEVEALYEHCRAIIVPEPAEVSLNFVPKLDCDVESALARLVADLLNH